MAWRSRPSTIVVLAVIAGFLAAAIPPLVGQIESFVHQIPDYVTQMKDHSTTLGKLDARFHIQKHVADATNSFSTRVGRPAVCCRPASTS